jgi:hypothetical protein
MATELRPNRPDAFAASEAEAMGSLGWSGPRGKSPLWVSADLRREYHAAQAEKLAIVDSAFEACVMRGQESRGRGVLDTPQEPVIGLAEGETRWRGMTVAGWAEPTGRADARRYFVLPSLSYCEMNAQRSLTSWSFLMPAKAILVPGILALGSLMYSLNWASFQVMPEFLLASE